MEGANYIRKLVYTNYAYTTAFFLTGTTDRD